MTTTDRIARPGRLTSVAGLVAVLALAGTGCSSSGPEEPLAAAEQAAEEGTALASDAIPAGPTESLLVALGEVGQSYSFESATSTPAGEQVTVTGRRIVDDLHYRIETAGVGVEMMSIGDQVWVLEDGATEWILDTGATPPSADPLAVFGSPESVRQLSGPDPASYLATYPAAAVGLEIEGSVDIQIDVDGTGLAFNYTDGASGLAMTVSITPSDELQPIIAPS